MKGVVKEADRYRVSLALAYEKLRNSGFVVDNLSKMGATVERGLKAISRREFPEEDDTLVVFSFGGNDCDFDWQKVSEQPKAVHSPNLSIESFSDIYRRCIEAARAKGARVALANLVPLDAPRYMDTISAGRSRENILSWLGDVSMLYRWHETYDREVEDIARREGCELVDLRSKFLLSRLYEQLIGPDGIHPTDQGYDIIQNTISDTALCLMG